MKYFYLFAVAILFASIVFAAPTISDMINNPNIYNGKFLKIRGQAIGSIMKRGNHAWVNMTDGSQTLGFWMPYPLAKKIKLTGNYNFKGDLLTVEGTFVAMSLKHGGDMEFDVSKIVEIVPGHRIGHKVDFGRVIFLIFISVAAFILWILKRKFFTARS